MTEKPDAKPQKRRSFWVSWSKRRGAVVAGLVAVALIAALVATQLPGLLSSSKAEPTVWQNITSGIQDGTVPKDVALKAFAYLYHVDIPGVTVPKGLDSADRPTSGSGALRWVQANWKQLTGDQQAVVTRVMTPGPNDTVVNIDATTGTVTSRSGPGGGGNGQRLALAVQPRAILGGEAQAAPSTQVEDAIEAELIADIQHIGTKLGLPVLQEGFGLWKNVTLNISEESGNGTLLTAVASLNKAGHYNPCAVTAYKESWENETGINGVSPTFHVLMTHEVIHCYQHVVEGDVDTANSVPPWITEGTAIYLAASDTGIAEPMIPSMWTKGYFFPETALTNRSYDAFGYYSLLQHLGRDIWARIVPAWKAAATSNQRSNAFIAVLQGDDPDVRNVWASSYLREQAWGDPWIAYGFGLPDSTQVIRHEAQAVSAPGWTGTLLGRSNTVLEVGSSSGEVVTITTTGLASVHDQKGASVLDFQSGTFCVSGECICPGNTPRAGEKAADQKLGLSFDVAFNAPEGGSSYSIVGTKLEEACGRKATPKPSQPGPCVGKCAGSNGDPHLLTINNFRYDFQAAGELTLLRSADGSLEIQTRQEPYSPTAFGAVATNTAIAARVGAHRVGIYATAGALQVRVDGTVTDVKATLDLGGGASISPYPKGLVTVFADGTKLWTLNVSPYGINVLLLPSSTLRASGTGLLGPITPGGLGVPALPDGTMLPAATDRHARHAVVYGRFADAWRVTDSSTLFDYEGGKSTATHTQKDFPTDTADVTADDLTPAQQAAGQTACGQIADQGLHDSCVFDVAVSGDAGFAQSYTATLSLYDSGIIAATPSPQGTGIEPTPPPGAVSGAIAITPASRLGGYAVGSDNKLYVSARVTTDSAMLFEVDPAAGTVVSHVTVPALTEVHVAGGSVWLPGLKTDSNGHRCSVTRFDGQTLTEQATILVPCGFFDSPETVSDGSALWFIDVTKYDGTTNKGAVLTRIDPVTNALGPSVDLPFINGNRWDSLGALFYFSNSAETGFYRLMPGDTSMTRLAPWNPGTHPGGTGLWVSSSDGKTAQNFSEAGGPQATLPIDGTLVAGDSSSAYVERNAAGASELWRYPINGSAAKIGTAPTLDGEDLGYFADPQSIVAPDGFIKLWLPSPSGANPRTLYFQWVPLP
jgi:hypothetical protein